MSGRNKSEEEWLAERRKETSWLRIIDNHHYITPEGWQCVGQDQRIFPTRKQKHRSNRQEDLQLDARQKPCHKYAKHISDVDKVAKWFCSDVDLHVDLNKVDLCDNLPPAEDPKDWNQSKETDQISDDPLLNWNNNRGVEKRILMTKEAKVPIGISITYNKGKHTGRLATPAFIHLVRLEKAMTINVRNCFEIAKGDYSFLRQMLKSNAINLFAQHAAVTSSILFTYCSLRLRLRNISTIVNRYESRTLAHLCCLYLEHTDLEDKLDPYFVKAQKKEGLEGDHIGSLRDAYHCCALGHAFPNAFIVNTLQRADDGKIRYYAQMARSFLGAKLDSSIAEELAFSRRRTRYLQARVDKEEGVQQPPRLKVPFIRRYELPSPSLSQVVKVQLHYEFYTKDDEQRIDKSGTMYSRKGGHCEIGVWAEMYGLVLGTSGRCAEIYFPRGIRAENGYNVIPNDVYRSCQLNCLPCSSLDVEEAPDWRKNKRMRIGSITLLGNEELSMQDHMVLDYGLKLLGESTSQYYDLNRSNLGGCLAFELGLGGEELFKKRNKFALQNSLLSVIEMRDDTFDCSKLYPAQVDSLFKCADKVNNAVALKGIPGAGKTEVLKEFLQMWLDRGREMNSSQRLQHYKERVEACLEIECQEIEEGEYISVDCQGDSIKRRKLSQKRTYETIPWKNGVHTLRPMCVLLTQTQESARSVAWKLPGSNDKIKFLLLKASRREEWDPEFYTSLDHCTTTSSKFATYMSAYSELKGCGVFISTLGGFANIAKKFCMVSQPQVVMVDEGSLLYAHQLVSSLQQFCLLAKLVIIGDERQLGPHLGDEMPELKSSLDAIMEYQASTTNGITVALATLNRSFRMPCNLTNFLSMKRYNGEMMHRDGVSPRYTKRGDHEYSVRFLLHHFVMKSSTSGISNLKEAEIVANLAAIYANRNVNFSIITYYKQQLGLIQMEIAKKFSQDEALKLKVDEILDKVFTIDGFQGREDRVIIFSTARSQLDSSYRGGDTVSENFVLSPRRLSVALSRVSHHMIIISNVKLLDDMGKWGPSLLVDLCTECKVHYYSPCDQVDSINMKINSDCCFFLQWIERRINEIQSMIAW